MANETYLKAMEQARDILPARIRFLDLELSPLTSTGFFMLYRTGLYKILLEQKFEKITRFLEGKKGSMDYLPEMVSLLKIILYVYLIQDTEDAHRYALYNADEGMQYSDIVKQSDALWKELLKRHGLAACMDAFKLHFAELIQDVVRFANEYIAQVGDQQQQAKKKAEERRV